MKTKNNNKYDNAVYYETQEEYMDWEKDMLTNEKEIGITLEELKEAMGMVSPAKKSKSLSFDDVTKKANDRNFERYMPEPEFYKPALGRLLDFMSEDDAREILDHLFKELSKDSRDLHISKRIETTIISMMVDRV